MGGKIKKGQVAIWIILAVVLVAAIILFFTIGQERNIVDIVTPDKIDSVNAPSFMQTCTEKYVLEAVDIMLPQGGFIAPENYIIYNRTNVEFLCTNIGFYEPCINQHPVLIKEMESEIRDYIYPKIESCFSEMKNEIEKRNGKVEYKDLEINVDLGEDKIFVTLDREVEIENKGVKKNYEEFNVVVESPAYNLAKIAVEIASQEAKYCYFEPVGYSLTYPRYDVSRYVMSDPINIYTIYDKKTGKFMMTAIRSCAIPPGL